MIVGIHQPNFMPWFGYFKKIQSSDKFVFLDDVKCSKNSYLNRNLFSTTRFLDKTFWLSCPISKENYKKKIQEVIIKPELKKKQKKNYLLRHKKTKEQNLLQQVLNIYEKYEKEIFSIADFNIEVIEMMCRNLEIYDSKKFYRSSNLTIENRDTLFKEKLVIQIVKTVEGSVYLSGKGASEYQTDSNFSDENIDLRYQQLNLDLVPDVDNHNISFLDIMLSEGLCKAKKMILV